MVAIPSIETHSQLNQYTGALTLVDDLTRDELTAVANFILSEDISEATGLLNAIVEIILN